MSKLWGYGDAVKISENYDCVITGLDYTSRKHICYLPLPATVRLQSWQDEQLTLSLFLLTNFNSLAPGKNDISKVYFFSIVDNKSIYAGDALRQFPRVSLLI